jgi:hypothetical protein
MWNKYKASKQKQTEANKSKQTKNQLFLSQSIIKLRLQVLQAAVFAPIFGPIFDAVWASSYWTFFDSKRDTKQPTINVFGSFVDAFSTAILDAFRILDAFLPDVLLCNMRLSKKRRRAHDWAHES